VNFVTAHDGFTLNDLVSYEQKHNEANGENNNDGANDNISRNWGVEGATEDPAILDLRQRMMKNFIATLAFSQGVPMLAHGDEIARTQNGNNNAYAQDNEITWMPWEKLEHDERARELLTFTRKCFAIRHANPVLRRRHFFRGTEVAPEGFKDVNWIRADGKPMEEANWNEEFNRVLGMLIHGKATDEVDDHGRPIEGETLLLIVNGGSDHVTFTLPEMDSAGVWVPLIDTATDDESTAAGPQVTLAPHSLVLLSHGTDRRRPFDEREMQPR
jgi:glycogen operon protein